MKSLHRDYVQITRPPYAAALVLGLVPEWIDVYNGVEAHPALSVPGVVTGNGGGVQRMPRVLS